MAVKEASQFFSDIAEEIAGMTGMGCAAVSGVLEIAAPVPIRIDLRPLYLDYVNRRRPLEIIEIKIMSIIQKINTFRALPTDKALQKVLIQIRPANGTRTDAITRVRDAQFEEALVYDAEATYIHLTPQDITAWGVSENDVWQAAEANTEAAIDETVEAPGDDMVSYSGPGAFARALADAKVEGGLVGCAHADSSFRLIGATAERLLAGLSAPPEEQSLALEDSTRLAHLFTDPLTAQDQPAVKGLGAPTLYSATAQGIMAYDVGPIVEQVSATEAQPVTPASLQVVAAQVQALLANDPTFSGANLTITINGTSIDVEYQDNNMQQKIELRTTGTDLRGLAEDVAEFIHLHIDALKGNTRPLLRKLALMPLFVHDPRHAEIILEMGNTYSARSMGPSLLLAVSFRLRENALIVTNRLPLGMNVNFAWGQAMVNMMETLDDPQIGWKQHQVAQVGPQAMLIEGPLASSFAINMALSQAGAHQVCLFTPHLALVELDDGNGSSVIVTEAARIYETLVQAGEEVSKPCVLTFNEDGGFVSSVEI